jgi:Putative Ig domain/Calx-beta domain
MLQRVFATVVRGRRSGGSRFTTLRLSGWLLCLGLFWPALSSAVGLPSTYPGCATRNVAVAWGGTVNVNLTTCHFFGLGVVRPGFGPTHGTVSVGDPAPIDTYNYTHNGSTPAGGGSDTFQILDDNSDFITVNVTIQAPSSPITVSPASLSAMRAGTPFAQTLNSSGGLASYTYSLQSGTLPLGLTLSNSGDITGTPTQRGGYGFTVRSTDATTPTAQFTDKGYGGTVLNPTLSLANGSLTLAQNVALGAGVQLITSGGVAPYAYQTEPFVGTAPAPGLTLSGGGLIAGTPTALGPTTTSVRVTDSSTGTGQYFEVKSLSIQVVAPPLVSIALSPPTSVAEDGSANLVYTVTRSVALSTPTVVNITTAGTAAAGTDYTGNVATVTILAGATTATITIDPTPDTTVELDKTVTLTVAAGTGYTVGSPANATGTIQNDDVNLPTLTLTKISNGGVGAFTFTGTNGWSSQTITTTTAGVGVSGATQTLAAAATATTITEVAPPGFVLSSAFCTGLGVGGTATPSGNSLTLDAAATAAGANIACTFTNVRLPTLTVTKISNGGVGAFTFTGTNGWSSQTITTTTAGVGVSGATQTLATAATATTITEAVPADFFVAGASCTGLGSGGTATLSGNSLTLDAAATAAGANITCTFTNTLRTLSIADVSLFEGDSGTTNFTFTVSLSAPAGAGGVSFDIATTNGTATAGSDYVANILTAQSIPAGSSTYAFTVQVNGDSTPEPNETFFVNVTNVVGAVVVDGQGIGTIQNDDVAIVQIHDIQGNGSSSPINGATVTTEGIVTALKNNNGFFLQTPDADVDADPSTSQGIFVFTSSAPPASAVVGNRVRVTGTVTEFTPSTNLNQRSITEIVSVTSVVVLSAGNPLPTPIILSASDFSAASTPDTAEKLEGMRVTIASARVVEPSNGNITESSATSSTDGVFQVALDGVARPLREPGIGVMDVFPIPAGKTPPRFDTNQERIMVRSLGQVGATAIAVASDATIANMTGVLDYFAGTWALLPDVASGSVNGGKAATPVLDASADEITLASVNLQRFFDEVNDSNGAPTLTAAALDKRLTKTSLAICDYVKAPDILGVTEAENLRVLGLLADRINSTCARAPQYVPYLVQGNDVGGINVGFLVSNRAVDALSRVEVLEVTQFGKTTVLTNPDSSTSLLNDRPPLLLRAIVTADNGARYPVTVIVNHLRGLTGIDDTSPGSGGWPTEGDRVRAKRGQQALFLAGLVQARQLADPAERIVLLGDFNAYPFSDGFVDVMGIVRGAEAAEPNVVSYFDSPITRPLTDSATLIANAGDRYASVANGSAQSLSHILVNEPIVTGAPLPIRVEHARINADVGVHNFGTPGIPIRVSSQDPIRIAIAVAPPISVSPTTLRNGTVGVGYSQTATASGGVGSYSFAVTSGALPGGLTLATTGALAGTPNAAGSFTFTITASDSSAAPGPFTGSRSYTVDIAQGTQTVTFAPASPLVFGVSPIALTATASSGLTAFTFSTSSAASICTVAGNQLTIVGAGSCALTATQPGNANYASASANATVVISPATQTVTFAPASPVTFGAAPIALSATASSGLTTFTFSTTSAASICTLSGNTVTITGAGTCALTATQPGNANYTSASANANLVINAASQTVTFAPASPVLFGAAPIALSASASSGLTAFSFATTSPSSICTLSGNTLTVVGVGTCALTASQAGDANYQSASANANVVINVAVPGAPTGLSATTGNAQATIGFIAPVFVGGAPITSYSVNCTPGSIPPFTGVNSPIAVTGLTNGVTYNCTVTASNSAGSGAASSPVQVTPSFTSYTAPSPTSGGTITASFTGGGSTCNYSRAQYIPLSGHPASPPAGSAPAGISFPYGLFDFATSGCTPGSTMTMTISYPGALLDRTAYWKYGPTPSNATPHWYQLPATIAGSTATFSITDGGLGDDDLQANGTIIDQGGPGVPPPLPVPLPRGWLLLMAILMAAMTARAAAQRRARS